MIKISKKNLISFSIYILEIFFMIIFSTSILDIIIEKVYNSHIPIIKCILALFSGIIALGIIIYIYINNKKEIEKIFLAVGISVGICFAIFILPFNVPDEETHMMKAYDISIGHIFPKIEEDKKSFCTVPENFQKCTCLSYNSYKDVYEQLNVSTDYNNNIQLACNAQGNSFILYIGSIISIFFCRIINVNLLFAMYICRICNLLIFLSFMYFSIKKIPFGKLTLAILCLFPIMMQQAASCSADAILNSVLIYYIAHLIYMVFKEDEITKKDKLILFVCTALIAMFKYIYILVAGILFLILLKNKTDKKENLKLIGITIVVGSLFMIGWYVFNLGYDSIPENIKEYYKTLNMDSGKQVEFIKENPIKFIIIIAKQFIIYGTDTLYSTIGSFLGWLNVELNSAISLGFILLILMSIICSKSEYEFSLKSKIWIITIYLCISVLVKIGMYLYSTPVGCSMICGIQGRYYTPILLLPLLCLIKKDNNWKVNYLYEKVFAISLLLNIFTMYYVIRFYI